MDDRAGYPIKRHREEHWWDMMLFQFEGSDFSASIKIHERWKESGLSGDEWRFSYIYEFEAFGDQICAASCNFPQYAILSFLTLFSKPSLKTLILNHPEMMRGCTVQVSFINRGVPMLTKSFSTFLDCLLCIGKVEAVALEDHPKIHDLHKSILARRCSQPGCPRVGVNPVRILKQYDRYGVLESNPLFPVMGRQFCSEHLHRGDCSLEDCDDNYLVNNPANT